MPRPKVYGLVVLLAACGSDPTDAGPLPAVALEVVSGGSQSQLAGYPLDAPVVVRAVGAEGAPVANVEVVVGDLPPGAELELSGSRTGPDGTLSATWRLAPRLGAQMLQLTMPSITGAAALNVSAEGTGAAVRAISGDARTGMCAVYLDGRLGCWKVNEQPPLVPPSAVIVDGPERYRDVAVSADAVYGGDTFGCAVTEAGRARCFVIPQGDSGPTAWSEVGGAHPALVQITGRRIGSLHATYCATDENGGAWCWGRNADGQVGDGTMNDADTPVQLAISDPVIDLSLDWSVGCALTTTGETWCWGEEWRNRLVEPAGTGPSRLDTDLRFTAIAVFRHQALCGITTAAILHCWGQGVPYALWSSGTGPFGGMGPSSAVQSFVGARSIVGLEDMTFVTTADGIGAWWGDLFNLHTPSSQWATSPRAPKYPFGFTTLIQREESRTICGRNGPTDPVICFRNEMLFSYPTHVVDPKLVIGFGVPGP